MAVLSARTFTFIDGRNLEGEIRAANEKKVTIKPTVDGCGKKVPLSVLIPAHQQDVASWLQVKSWTKLTFTATKDQETSPASSTGGTTAVKTAPVVVQSMKSLSYSSSTTASGDRVTEVASYKWDEALSGLGVSLLKGNERVVRWKTGRDPGAANHDQQKTRYAGTVSAGGFGGADRQRA